MTFAANSRTKTWGSRNGVPWTSEEVDLLCELKAVRKSWSRIAHRMKRSVSSVFNKWRELSAVPPLYRVAIPCAVLEERDRRSKAYDLRDLTGQRFNDPPVGFSALDRLRESKGYSGVDVRR